MNKLLLLAVSVALALGTVACKTGNPNQRNDIMAAVNSTKPPLDQCFQMALARNRHNNGGFLTVEFVAEASTGQFKNVLIRRDEVHDPAVSMCVINAVSALKLNNPPASNVTVSYAFRFIPQN